ncbi:hypothetical protein HY641_04055 [Candidatus Woesearchaeota archaeon]|nr:hypothetical protein [Candidatus Woesearchaeota archaeon]
MSSNNQSNAFDCRAYLIGCVLLAAVALKYEAQIKQATITLLAIISAVALLFGTWTFVHYLRSGKSRIHSPTGTDVDLTTIEDEDFDDEIAWEGQDGQIPIKHAPDPQVSHTPFEFKTEYTPDPLLDVPVHRADTLNPVQVCTLERAGYHKQDFVPVGEKRRQTFYVREDGGNLEHAFVVYSIINLLKGKAEGTTAINDQTQQFSFWSQLVYCSHQERVRQTIPAIP